MSLHIGYKFGGNKKNALIMLFYVIHRYNRTALYIP